MRRGNVTTGGHRASLVALTLLPFLTCPASAFADANLECALPVVLRSAVRDIHESWFNGPEGFAFIAESGAEKVGDVPVEVGQEPVRRFDIDVYASNFQGPILVRRPNLRAQWEWTAAGDMQVSERSYPLLAARACATTASALRPVTLHIDEHDEWPWQNDAVGAFTVDLALCKEVLSSAQTTGWTRTLRAEGASYSRSSGASDVSYVDYELWCYRCGGDRDCETGIRWK